MKKKFIFFILIIFIVICLGIFIGLNIKKEPVKQITSSQSSTNNSIQKSAFVITKENLPSVLEKQGFIKDIPSDGIIILKFYNFNTGERQWEESYILKKGSVTKGSASESDLTIIISSKYLSQMGNICNAIKKAKANGDIGYESTKSDTALMWKFRSMIDYKDCLS